MRIGGRGVKRRSDGVVYTQNKKRIAVHWAFGQVSSRQMTVKKRAQKLGVGLPTLYDWRKTFPEASNPSQLNSSSPLAEQIRAIAARSADQNLAAFLLPEDETVSWQSFTSAQRGSSPNASTSSPSSAGQLIPSPSASASSQQPNFVRPDGLGPTAEPESTFGARGPGVLPPDLVGQLERAGALATDEEVATVHAIRPDDDADEGATQFINETVDLTLHLKQSTLAPAVKANWDRCKKHFLTFWRCLHRIRARQDTSVDDISSEEVREDVLEEVLVSEQKLVTYLNCYVLHKNPRLGDEGIETHIKAITNLWETQVLQGRNSFPHPRGGALLKAFTKAIRHGRSALAEARNDDQWKHSLKDGYDREDHVKISKWYLEQADPFPFLPAPAQLHLAFLALP
ncbi:unnamed protein product [Tilletia caries]|nr:unnamed protein product [Tilletia caries]